MKERKAGKLVNIIKLWFLIIKIRFCYIMVVASKKLLKRYIDKRAETFFAIEEIRPDLRSKLTEKYY